ncbi:hypothetical protein Cgig2_019817 [Carnegiea gigantea]|uniref:Uncharacterized protein n=1 Tax=Carnegiea gigantea TaxID=171969 RepID=A0A9Q1Q996_9CARY|nr:hypothetical protein Cgig2_019817 [Carnegiea gigantea]
MSLQASPNNEQLKLAETQAREHYTSIISSALAIIKQQCKAEWIGYGDASTRKLESYVYELKDEKGRVQQGFPEVARVLQSFYGSLLGPSSPTAPLNPQIIAMGSTLSLEQQMDLCTPFTRDNIKEALFSIPGIKSPELDGFNSTFFKATWDITGPLVCQAINQFFQTAQLSPNFGKTKLVLLPKIQNPTETKDF